MWAFREPKVCWLHVSLFEVDPLKNQHTLFHISGTRTLFAALLVFVASGCASESGDDSNGSGAGGSVGTGGDAGTGGSGTGGAGTGGAGTGGAGTGGAGSGGLGSGGVIGSGGAPSTGGMDATGGTPGTGGTDLGTGGEVQTGYQPCPAEGPCKILPLGDSITHGMRQTNSGYVFDGGYRIELFRLATEDGHDITFTGTQPPNGPDTVAGQPFPKDHEGVSGDVINGIATRGVNAIQQETPHIILVHAGTNDLNGMSQGMSDRLGNLMDDLIENAPDALVVVSSIIPFTGGEVSYNATIEPMVETRANAGAHIIFVDQHEGFPNSELGDGVHPNTEGYARMGAKWYGAIESYLP